MCKICGGNGAVLFLGRVIDFFLDVNLSDDFGEAFVPEGNHLRLLSDGAGTYELTYYAYPAFTDMEADADTEIGLDDFASDAIAYGAAAELCQNIYPGDMTRYMRLVTEWEERIAHICPTSAETKISNTVFTKERRHV